MNLCDYIVEFLQRKGVEKVFCVYGSANSYFIKSLADKNMQVCTTTENGAGFAAEGYSKINGFSCVTATSGPGAICLLNGLASCWYDSTPALFITGQVNTKFMRPDNSIRQVGFQETPILEMVAGITKYAKMVTNKEDIKYEIEKAYFLANEGRNGPVLLDLPINVQHSDINPEELIGYIAIEDNYYDNQTNGLIDEFLTDLSNAQRPAILIGGGCQRDKEKVRSMLSYIDIPTYTTWNALDIISPEDSYYAGQVGTYGSSTRNFGIQNCDLLLCLGSRLSGRITGGHLEGFARAAKKYVVDIDKALLQRKMQPVKFDRCIYSSVAYFCEEVMNSKHKLVFDIDSWRIQNKTWLEKYDPVKPEYYEDKSIIHPYAFMRTLSEVCKKDDIILSDCGGNVVVSNSSFKVKNGQRFFSSNGHSSMSFSFPGSIGAWYANKNPKSNIICIIGDGGMGMQVGELQTLKNYGIKVKVFILNNHIYGITRKFQKINFVGTKEHACSAPDYQPPDFVKVAEAYGIKALYIKQPIEWDDIKNHIRYILSLNESVICSVECPDFCSYYPAVSGWNPIEDMEPLLSLEELQSNMYIPLLKETIERERPNGTS